MNFFEDQRLARKKTKRLVFLFLSSVFLTSLLLSIIIGFILFMGVQSQDTTLLTFDYIIGYWDKFLFLLLFFGAVILATTMYKINTLGTGGEYVATLLGASRLRKKGASVQEKKYINIVEEMSIASGTPIPKIFIMRDEPGINAFAAGYEIDDCVVCVTSGAIEKLSRDELQGVIAHEFSHIFNGDMKLNIKLIGYLFGLLAISQLGRIILNTGRYRSYSSRRNKDSNGIYMIGGALFIIGGIGYLLGSMIKSSISKQREFLADASAVQFTRNPAGIGGALRKIFHLSEGSEVQADKSEEVSHMFFNTALKLNFASHPPLEKRLEKLYPKMSWAQIKAMEVKYPDYKKLNSVENDRKDKEAIDGIFMEDAVKVATTGAILSSFTEKKDKIGVVEEENMEKAKSLISQIPFSVQGKISTIEGATEVILDIFNGTSSYNPRFRYPIFEISLHTLGELEKSKKQDFVLELKNIILRDKKITPAEFIHFYLIKRSLLQKTKFFETKPSKSQIKSAYKELVQFTRLGLNDEEYSFQTKVVSEALDTISASNENIKKQVLDKIINLIKEDNLITPLEEEFVRLVCQGFRVPYPL